MITRGDAESVANQTLKEPVVIFSVINLKTNKNNFFSLCDVNKRLLIRSRRHEIGYYNSRILSNGLVQHETIKR
jgi:hypothetical protein